MYVERKEGIGDGQLKSGVHRIFFSFLFIKKIFFGHAMLSVGS